MSYKWGLHSGNLTWQWNIPMFSGKYIFTGSIFNCYVGLPEGYFPGMIFLPVVEVRVHGESQGESGD